ncbi:MAG: hypothetical protein NW224_09760, partial [Leptolyngbyaceae cyanobacterium bins.302]|nr:hypothetical protein [Leptolyngbyaceae cyanobacterium bins.302]
MTIIQTEPKVTSEIEPTQLNGESTQLPTPRDLTFGIRHKVSIRVLVVTSFVVPMVTAVGLTGWLSIRHGQRAVNEMAGRLQTEVSARVSTHLNAYLSIPHQLNQINLDAVELKALDLQNFKMLGQYFWRQMKVFNIGYNSYANKEGEFIGVERLDDGNLLINEVSNSSAQGKLYVYQTDHRGNRTTLQETKDYDPRIEAWYAEAAEAGHPLWSKVYQWEDKPEVLSVSSSYPVYDKNKTFLGV